MHNKISLIAFETKLIAFLEQRNFVRYRNYICVPYVDIVINVLNLLITVTVVERSL